MNGPLSIAHTESSLGWGGQEIRTLTEAAGFIRRGHRVVVYAAAGARIVAEAPRFGVPIVALPIGRKRLRGVRSLVATLARNPVDIVNAHSSTDAWLDALACVWLERTRRAAPVLVRTRHVSIPVPNDRATRWLYRRATARVVTTGLALREQLIRDNGLDAARVDSVPTGIDAAMFAPISSERARRQLALPQAVPLVGIIATLRSWKGHRYLIDAMQQLRNADAHLVIVGEAHSARRSKRRWIDSRCAGASRLPDNRTTSCAGSARSTCSCAVVCERRRSASAAAGDVRGDPCVTTDAGAIPEIARDGDTARVVPREDAQALAAAIDALLADRNAGARLAQRAREHVVPRFGLDLMLDRMERVFRTALAESAYG